MIRAIVRDPVFLRQPSVPAGKNDMDVIRDLIDTYHAHQSTCAGMAANMIGVNKNIIIMNAGLMDVVMINPYIISHKGKYEVMEGCLSLSGKRKTDRYQEITVRYENMNFEKEERTFTGYPAEIIQHEIDHLHGILI